MRLAAESGIAAAQFDLAWRLERGDGMQRDDGAALELYLKAAAQGHPTATNNIGAFIANGRVVPRDRPRALAWYVRAVALGNAIAMANVAWHYDTGSVVGKDAAKAYFWNSLAVRFGRNEASADAMRLAQALATNAREQIDLWVRNYRFDDFEKFTAELRAASDTRDFVSQNGNFWTPTISPVLFRYPATRADRSNKG